jgi:hypothetical protein
MNKKQVARELVKIAKIISAAGWEPDEVEEFKKIIESSKEKYRKQIAKGRKNASADLKRWHDNAYRLKSGSANPRDGEEYKKLMEWINVAIDYEKAWYRIFGTMIS